MIKEKLEKCGENSSSQTSIKEESATCDSAGKDSGSTDNVMPKVEEDVASNTTNNGKDCSRSSTTGTTSTNATTGSGTGASTGPTSGNAGGGGVGGSGNTSVQPTTSDDDTPGNLEPPPTTTQDNPTLPEPTDLQSDSFSELGSLSSIPSTGTTPTTRQGPLVPSHPRPPLNGVQPLPSNMIGKQTNNMEVQYMQQQSQIFVFSTLLANKSADAVLQGHFHSIIAYHCAQPGTKKYLEKHPLKVAQFRQSPAQWLNGLAMMKSKGCTRAVPNFAPKSLVDGFSGPDAIVDEMSVLADATDSSWEQRSNHHLGLDGGSTVRGQEDTILTNESPVANTLVMGHSPCVTSPASPSLANLQPSLQGVKVPDEDLTPQQRQHREEQLATIRKMHQMLFPEHTPISLEEQDMNASGMPVGSMPSCQGVATSTGMSEWQKLQNQMFENKMKPDQMIRPPGPPCGATLPSQFTQAGPRLQGPPPPYHQTPRSASVPIALQSPGPASPNNPTSNLSLPSPRTSSALNSPAAEPGNRQFGGLGRHFGPAHSPTSQSSPSGQVRTTGTVSNPGTPSAAHFSPSATSSGDQIPPSGGGGDFSTNTPTAGTMDGMFCRTLQSMAQKQHLSGVTDATGSPSAGNKEPNLMPVPSPQQIQYLNTFEGQELTIQKQPNTSLKDGNLISPSSMEGGFSNNEMNTSNGGSRVSAPNTPLTPSSVDMGPRFPSNPSLDCYRRSAGSPDTKPPRPPCTSGPSPQSLKTSPVDRYPLPGVGGSPGSFPLPQPGQKTGGMVNLSPSGKSGNMESSGMRADNVPLNPNSNNGLSGNPKVSHFDPISSLAQMSQLLTSTVSSSLNGQSTGPGVSLMPYGGVNAPVMDMGGCVSDLEGGMMGMGPSHVYGSSGIGPAKNMQFMGPQRMMRPNMPPQGPMAYNGASVQVKASAPNTIQYLPARPQVGPTNPRGPPSLDFLQRFANPNMEPKMVGGPNMQYFPGCVVGPNNMDGDNPMHGDGIIASIMNSSMMGKMPMGGGMSVMRQPGPRPPMGGPMRMHGGFDVPDGMYPGPGPGQQMFGPKTGPLVGPMGRGLCAPDAAQPLPPSVGQGNGYKNSPFAAGPTTTDPNYAQQFHNFQQQLYATSTRSQLNSQTIGPGPGPPTPQPPNNSMYFMSK